jgi:hypothetical protein
MGRPQSGQRAAADCGRIHPRLDWRGSWSSGLCGHPGGPRLPPAPWREIAPAIFGVIAPSALGGWRLRALGRWRLSGHRWEVDGLSRKTWVGTPNAKRRLRTASTRWLIARCARDVGNRWRRIRHVAAAPEAQRRLPTALSWRLWPHPGPHSATPESGRHLGRSPEAQRRLIARRTGHVGDRWTGHRHVPTTPKAQRRLRTTARRRLTWKSRPVNRWGRPGIGWSPNAQVERRHLSDDHHAHCFVSSWDAR